MAMWLISVPAWGTRYIALATRLTLPSLAAALARTALPHLVVIHTDDAAAFGPYPSGLNVEFREPSDAAGYAKYYLAHQEVVASSRKGEFVSLLPGDCVVSVEFFVACERRFAQGKKAVATLGNRTLSSTRPPIGAAARALMDWSLDNLHPISWENIWGSGKTMLPSIVYFMDAQSIVMHSFNYGIVAFAHDGRDMTFKFTHDHDLPGRFTRAEVHVVTDADELAIVECSGAAKPFPIQDVTFGVQDVADWARAQANSEWNRYFFAQPFVLWGEDSGISRVPVAQILATLDALQDETPAQIDERSMRGLRRKIANNERRGARYSLEEIEDGIAYHVLEAREQGRK